MKAMMILSILMIDLAAGLLVGCAKDPISSNVTNNPDMIVSKLFTNGSCTIYRFQDGGYLHYYAECGTEAASTNGDYRCGKSCNHKDEIPTGVNNEQR